IFYRDPEEAACQAFRRKVADLRDEASETFPNKFYIDWQIAVGTKYFRKEARGQASEHHITIGHRKRTVASVTDGPRVGACALRADTQSSSVKAANGTSPGGNSVNMH